MTPLFRGLALADLLALAAAAVLGLTAGPSPEAAERHAMAGLLAGIFTAFVHSLVFVYLLGTGRTVKEAVESRGLDRAYVRETKDFKREASPAATGAILLVALAAILGAAAGRGPTGRVLHVVAALGAIVVGAAAFPVELRVLRRNGDLMSRLAEDLARATGEPLPAPAPPPASAVSQTLFVLAASALVVYAYARWIARARDLPWIPFAAAAAGLALAGAIAGARARFRRDQESVGEDRVEVPRSRARLSATSRKSG